MKMRLVTWNCNMALHKKFEHLCDMNFDIAAVQECSKKYIDQINDGPDFEAVWTGQNQNKGLAVIVRKPFRIQVSSPSQLNLILRVSVSGPADLDIFAIWACKGESGRDNYVRQVHLLLDEISKNERAPNTILLGDFNSSSIWDHEHGTKSHSAAVDRLSRIGITSAYHTHLGERQGSETKPTIYFRRNPKRGYHIDYVFLSRALSDKLTSVEVGDKVNWLELSDHMPILAELTL